MQTQKEKIIKLIEPLLWDTPITADQAFLELNNNSEFGNQIKARLLGYVSWYKLLSGFEIETIFQWVDDEAVKQKIWPDAVNKKYESIKRILSK